MDIIYGGLFNFSNGICIVITKKKLPLWIACQLTFQGKWPLMSKPKPWTSDSEWQIKANGEKWTCKTNENRGITGRATVSILVAEHNLVTSKANVESSLIVTPLCA